MVDVQANRDELHFGASLTVRFMRTLRVPDDGNEYVLPCGSGELPIYGVKEYLDRVPASWRITQGVFIPMYQSEAMWLDFSGRRWKPNAVKVGVGRINAATGGPWHEQLWHHPQDYLVCPEQTRFVGFKTEDGTMRQFVAPPLGSEVVPEGWFFSQAEFSSIQLMVFEPKPGRFPNHPFQDAGEDDLMAAVPTSREIRIRVGAASRLQHTINPDDYGLETWNMMNYGRVHIHIVNSEVFRQITGAQPPATPISTQSYGDARIPWLPSYNEVANAK